MSHLPRTNDHLHCLRRNMPQLLLLMALAFAAYGEVLTHQFLVNWDDTVYITQNQAIRGFSLQNLKQAFSTYFVGNYAPLQIVSYMLDFTLWGGNPFGYLLANILYHCLSGILLYGLLLRHGFSRWGAFFGTAVFLVHPVQVESVAWLSQRKNLLAMLLYLAAFHSYLNCRELRDRQFLWYGFSLVLFVMALLAKSVAVILPLTLILYDLLEPPVRRHLRMHLDKIPYFAAAAVTGIVALVSQSEEHGGGRIDYPPNPFVTIPLTMLPVLARYLGLLLWPLPSRLSVIYFPPMRSAIDAEVVAAFVLAVVLLAVGGYLYRTAKPGFFWYILFFVGLLPVSQIFPLITLMNDRYLYFPMIGVAGLVAFAGDKLWQRAGEIRLKRALAGTAFGLVLALSLLSHIRGKVWRNSVALFSDLVAKYPDQSASWSRLAEGYIATGDISLAQYYYEKAVLLGGLDNDGIYNLVQIYFEKGAFAQADELIGAMLSRGDQANRGTLLLGEYHYRTGNYEEAENNLLQYLATAPDSAIGLYLLGQTYLMTGYTAQAYELYQKSLAAGGTHAGLMYSLSCAELRLGNPDRAAAALRAAFERGLPAKDLKNADACLQEMRSVPGLREIIRQHGGE